MSKSNQERIHDGIETFKQSMMKMDRSESAYFAYAIDQDGHSGITSGGRVDLSGTMLSWALANMVRATPGLGEEYIDTVHSAAIRMYRDLQEGILKTDIPKQ